MDLRRTLGYGGSAVAVGTAAVLSLAVSHAVALKDVAAFPVSAAPIMVPAGPSSPNAARVAAPTRDDDRRMSHAVAQTVPAPQPGTVGDTVSVRHDVSAADEATVTRQSSSVKNRTPAKAGPSSGHDLPREWTGSERKKSRSSSPAERD